MAAPHVAGGLALLREAYPGASLDQVESALQVTTDASRYRYSVIRVNRAADVIAPHVGNRMGALSLSSSAQVRFEHHQLSGSPTPYRDFVITNDSAVDDSWIVSADADWITFQYVVDGNPVGEPVTALAGGVIPAGSTATVRVGIAPDGVSTGYHHSVVWFGSYTVASRMPVPVHLSLFEPLPPNDDLANAFRLSGHGGIAAFSNRFATAQQGEPSHAGRAATRSVWWTLTPRESATYLITTDQASFDTVLSVFGGQTLESLTELASNDDNPAGGTMSSLEIALTGGQSYQIAVDGYDDAEFGTGALNARPTPGQPPANDEITNALGISGSRGRVDVNMTGATRNLNENEFSGAPVWYRWQAPSAGRFAFFDRAVSGNARIDIFDFANPVNQLRRGGYDEAAPDSVTVEVEAGETLYVGIHKVGGTDSSDFASIYWYPLGEPGEPLRSAVLPNNRAVAFGDWATAFATLINPPSYGRAVENCEIRPPRDFTGEFHFQTTDPATNTPTGSRDAPVNLSPGAVQSFVISIRSAQIEARDIDFEFVCDDETAPVSTAVNSFRLSTVGQTWPDIISIAATPSGNGILDLEHGRTSAFAVAIVNAGGPGVIDIAARRWSGDLTGSFCETDPSTGQCVSDRRQMMQLEMSRGQVRTFTVFVAPGSQADIPLNPSVNRYGIEFVAFSGVNSSRAGSASAAVRTVSE